MKAIDTNVYSLRLRAAAFNAETDQLLVSELAGSNQEEDLTDPPNCDGYGRIRHFTRLTAAGWPPNPLPMVPACAALGLPPVEMIRAQVFQKAACNWRCWYCFVPFDLLSANKKRSAWFTAAELVDMYLAVPDRPPVLDLSGGQPDLIPEWAPRTLRALDVRGVTDVYVWSDDNLSNDYFWRYLGDDDRALLASHPRYGRVACFKGFDRDSFMFNTAAAPELFDRQFELFARLAGHRHGSVRLRHLHHAQPGRHRRHDGEVRRPAPADQREPAVAAGAVADREVGSGRRPDTRATPRRPGVSAVGHSGVVAGTGPAGAPRRVIVRIAQRLLALAAVIWHNWKINAPVKRSLIAYDH